MSAPLLDAVAILAALPDDAALTFTLSKADLVRALELRGDAGPANFNTRQAAARFGYSADRWRRWADAGRLAGAWQDAPGGSWHLPLASCETHIRELQRRGRATIARGASPEPSSRSVPRGPRRSRASRPASPGDHAGASALSIEAARAARASAP